MGWLIKKKEKKENSSKIIVTAQQPKIIVAKKKKTVKRKADCGKSYVCQRKCSLKTRTTKQKGKRNLPSLFVRK